MPRSPSDPSWPRTKIHEVYLGFNPLHKMNPLATPEDSLAYATDCRYDGGFVRPIFKVSTGTQGTIARMPWMTANERPFGLIDATIWNTAQKEDAFYISNERLCVISALSTATTQNKWTLGGTVAKGAGAKELVGTSTDFTSEGMAYGTKLLINGVYYTLNYVVGPVSAFTVENLATFTGETCVAYNINFQAQGVGSYGPRYAFVADSLVLIGGYATYRIDNGMSHLIASSRRWRGRDIVSAAGRPVLCGVYEGASGGNDYYGAGYGFWPTMLRWPTRLDIDDWSGYGSGFLMLEGASQILAAANWGADAYVFTATQVYRIVETGLSAANPIQAYKVPVAGYLPPRSNVVAGQKGLYWYTFGGGLVRFDGRSVEPLYLMLGTSLYHASAYPPYMQYVPALRAIIPARDYDHPSKSSYQWIFFEDVDGFAELSEGMCFCGIAGEDIDWWVLDSTSLPATATVYPVREVDDLVGTQTPSAGTLTYMVRWKITQDPHILKKCAGVRIFYGGSGTIGTVYMCPINGSDQVTNVVLAAPTGELGVEFLDPPSTVATKGYPAWEVILSAVPHTVRIYGVHFLYQDGGNVGAFE